jgi:UDP-2,3-diacylglucosamine hydrolase
MQIDFPVTRLFVSDLHLESVDSAQFQRFCELLIAWRDRASEIYLLGDITEMWIGDDDRSELPTALCALLRETSACCPLYLMPGNRDFLYGQQISADTGVHLLNDPTRLPDGVLIAHGDAYCIDDAPYQQFRALVRDPAWQRGILGRSLDERRLLGASLREQSRTTNANKAANIMDVNVAAVQAALAAMDCHSMVHGHTHRPARHVLPAGERVVLGSWDGFVGWYAIQRGAAFSLHPFSLAPRYEIESQDPSS